MPKLVFGANPGRFGSWVRFGLLVFLMAAVAGAHFSAEGQPRMPQLLTVDLVRKFFVTQAKIIAATPVEPAETIAAFSPSDAARAYELNAVATRVLSDVGWTAEEFATTTDTIIKTMIATDQLETGAISKLPSDVRSENIQLLQNLPTDLSPIFQLWKDTTLDPALKELRKARGKE